MPERQFSRVETAIEIAPGCHLMLPRIHRSARPTWDKTWDTFLPGRRRAEEVSGTNLSERVPVPAGQGEVSALAVTMKEMLDRLESHRDSLRQFTANASHELKSPIANLRLLVETTRLDDPAWLETKDRLVGGSDRLGESRWGLVGRSDPRPFDRDTWTSGFGVEGLLKLLDGSEFGCPTL
ncbi:MAG: signal transduction histidine kinase [Acidimicrobiales bacterium]|jgi:signal transduction histidine kinase